MRVGLREDNLFRLHDTLQHSPTSQTEKSNRNIVGTCKPYMYICMGLAEKKLDMNFLKQFFQDRQGLRDG